MFLLPIAFIYHVSAFFPTQKNNFKPISSTRMSGRFILLDSSIARDDCASQSQDDSTLFFELMSPISTAQPDQMSAPSLAYLGDVVFELFIRSRYVWPNRRMPQLQNTVVSLVNGE
jgi:hypothetical protein